jgi:hypothetical protein
VETLRVLMKRRDAKHVLFETPCRRQIVKNAESGYRAKELKSADLVQGALKSPRFTAGAGKSWADIR